MLDTGAIRRRGKSELRRAGWSVTRTVPGRKAGGKESATENIPPYGIGGADVPQGKGEKVR